MGLDGGWWTGGVTDFIRTVRVTAVLPAVAEIDDGVKRWVQVSGKPVSEKVTVPGKASPIGDAKNL